MPSSTAASTGGKLTPARRGHGCAVPVRDPSGAPRSRASRARPRRRAARLGRAALVELAPCDAGVARAVAEGGEVVRVRRRDERRGFGRVELREARGRVRRVDVADGRRAPQGPLGNARSGRLSLSPRAVSARSPGVSGASRKSRLGRVWGVSAASGGVWPASGPASRVWAASLARLSRPAGLASVPGSSFVVVGSVLGWSLASFFSRPGRVPRLRRVSAASRGVLAASCRVPELASPASRPRLQDATLPRGPSQSVSLV